jgi:hypothetical protein
MRIRDYIMNKEERALLVHCLSVAATTFDDQARALRTAAFSDDTFTKQAADARALADRLENADYLKVGREVPPR